MEIVHSIAYWNSWHKSLKPRLEMEGIKFKQVESFGKGKDIFISFDISESHPAWKEISRLSGGILEKKYFPILSTLIFRMTKSWVRNGPG
jgi:hypothetical protein